MTLELSVSSIDKEGADEICRKEKGRKKEGRKEGSNH
jgi:hypothetical protein